MVISLNLPNDPKGWGTPFPPLDEEIMLREVKKWPEVTQLARVVGRI